jgi:anaerobic magnesium-protoporphyrin IX monomethyl ester cyclase
MQLANEGYRQLVFVDDNFTLNPKRVINLCRAMQKEKLNLEWVCEGRVDNCSIDMLREMVKAGLKVLYFGVESANQRILDYYNKKTTSQQAENAVRIARKAGVDVIVGSFILGASTETRREIQNTLDFARHLPVDIRQFSILGLYPGSEIWDEFEKNGLFNIEEYWETGITVPEIAPSAVPLKDLKRMVNEAFFHNLAHPRFLFEQCIRTLKSQYRMSVVLSNLHRLREIRRNIHIVA